MPSCRLTEPRDAECAAKLAKRTLTNLYNERPAWLANAHAKLDAAVAAAYGWPDIAAAWKGAEAGQIFDFATKTFAQLATGEKDFSAAMDAQARAIDYEILARLLALNLARAADESKAATVKVRKSQRGKGEADLL